MSRPADAPRVGLHRVLGPRQGPFALLRRASSAPTPAVTAPDRVELLLGDVVGVSRLADIPLPEAPRPGPGHDVLAVVPFRQVSERGFDCRDDASPILVLSVTEQAVLEAGRACSETLPDDPGRADRTRASTSTTSAYAEIVRAVLAEEIGTGEGCQLRHQAVVRHCDGHRATSARTALAVFRRLLARRDRRLLDVPRPHRHAHLRRRHPGAPRQRARGDRGDEPDQRHLPLPGPAGPRSAGSCDFLADRKETDELYMVVDEELKMMARVCDAAAGWSGRTSRRWRASPTPSTSSRAAATWTSARSSARRCSPRP